MRKILGVIALLMLTSSAFAGVTIHDRAGIIPQGQQNNLVSNGARWPFDLHVLTSAFPNPGAMNAAVDHCVTGPNVVCIGIDPVHHKTVVRAGSAVGLPSDNSIAAAGNSYFRSGDVQGGIEAIASRARDLAHTVVHTGPDLPSNPPLRNYTVQPQVQVHIDNPVPTGMTTGWWLFLFGMIALAGFVAYCVIRAVKTAKKVNEDMNDFRDEAFEMSSRNIEEAGWHEKMKAKGVFPATTATPAAQKVVVTKAPTTQTVVNPGPAPVASGTTTVVHNHYGSSGGYNSGPSTLTGSVMTDVMLANELTRPAVVPVAAPAPVVVEHEVVRESHSDSGSSSSWGNDDDNSSSGSSSSWGSSDNDSSSGSSSSWDSGSSSSDSSSSSDWGSSSDSGSSDWGGGSDSGSSGGGDSGW